MTAASRGGRSKRRERLATDGSKSLRPEEVITAKRRTQEGPGKTARATAAVNGEFRTREAFGVFEPGPAQRERSRRREPLRHRRPAMDDQMRFSRCLTGASAASDAKRRESAARRVRHGRMETGRVEEDRAAEARGIAQGGFAGALKWRCGT